jgi:hypothetical protein
MQGLGGLRLLVPRLQATICRSIAAALLVVVFGVHAGHAIAKKGLDFDLDNWRIFTPVGKNAAQFEIGEDGVIEVKADNAISFLYREIPPEARQLGGLNWRWRIDQLPPSTDLSKSKNDDRPLAVHVWFGKRDADSSIWDRAKEAAGLPVFSNVVTYVWGGRQSRGDMIPNPHLDDSVLVILRGMEAGAGQWFSEIVRPIADFHRAFGRPPPTLPMYIAISTDTDDAGGSAIGRIADLEITPLP